MLSTARPWSHLVSSKIQCGRYQHAHFREEKTETLKDEQLDEDHTVRKWQSRPCASRVPAPAVALHFYITATGYRSSTEWWQMKACPALSPHPSACPPLPFLVILPQSVSQELATGSQQALGPSLAAGHSGWCTYSAQSLCPSRKCQSSHDPRRWWHWGRPAAPAPVGGQTQSRQCHERDAVIKKCLKLHVIGKTLLNQFWI